jgi:energy-coupling factor transporter ATP-binding protein EcfA2
MQPTIADNVAGALRRIRIISDEEDAERTRADRRSQLHDTWARCPRKLRGHKASPVLEAAAESWVDGGSLILGGPSGCGKSTAAVRLVARLLRAGVNDGGDAFRLARGIVWVRADALTEAGGQHDDEHAQRLMQRARQCRLLVLDDLAIASKTILKVFEARYDPGLPIVITTGALSPSQFAESIGGDAVYRWLLHIGKTEGKMVIGKAKR